MVLKEKEINIILDDKGIGTEVEEEIIGYLESIYIDVPENVSVDFRVTTQEPSLTLLERTQQMVSEIYFPRVQTCDGRGTALIDAARFPLYDNIVFEVSGSPNSEIIFLVRYDGQEDTRGDLT